MLQFGQPNRWKSAILNYREVAAAGGYLPNGETTMAEKTKSTVRQVATAVQDVVATVVTAAKEHVVQPVGSALGISGDATKDADQKAGAEAEAAVPAKKNVAAVRMMTKSIAIKQPSKAKGKS